MFHIHGVWTRTTGIGLLFFYLSFRYLTLSILFFSFILVLLIRLFTLPYYFGMFHFLVWFGFGFGFFSLVSMLVWSRSRWTVRVACLFGLEADWRVYCGRELIKIHTRYGLVG